MRLDQRAAELMERSVRHRVYCPKTGEIAADFPGHQFDLAKALADRLARETGNQYEVHQTAVVYKTKEESS